MSSAVTRDATNCFSFSVATGSKRVIFEISQSELASRHLIKASLYELEPGTGELGSRLLGKPSSAPSWHPKKFFTKVFLSSQGRKPIQVESGEFDKVLKTFNRIRNSRFNLLPISRDTLLIKLL